MQPPTFVIQCGTVHARRFAAQPGSPGMTVRADVNAQGEAQGAMRAPEISACFDQLLDVKPNWNQSPRSTFAAVLEDAGSFRQLLCK